MSRRRQVSEFVVGGARGLLTEALVVVALGLFALAVALVVTSFG